MKRLIAVFVILSIIVALPFVFWGEWFEGVLSGTDGIEYLRSWGAWAWLVAIGLLMTDLLLPIPATAVMGALGAIYGPVVGGVVGTTGSCMAALTGYWLCWKYGRTLATRIAGAEDLAKSGKFFERSGGMAIAVSRWLPVLPEAMSCMAGIVRMSFLRFLTALLCGTVPMAFFYASIGDVVESKVVAILLCAGLPILLWGLVAKLILRTDKSEDPADSIAR